ncbi:Epidermal growth factor receptor substrate 15-like 1 [Pseudolycoriella hygida]|uniref:Epidermal growth factor receptor substrate 15-like 1 n=1 Tax=Pseudolycoriella hygida TaxID=35572 RepID=A0A9Q0S525_9DIPT|nr:Epidermal growth factor receptor substrate 15-like 1 [Pseudolycoriella hygida]
MSREKMAMNLPSPTEVSGKHNAIFEAYLQKMDPKSTGVIEAMAAATFLKKSGLSDVVLSRIWDLSDPAGRGYLDKKGFFVALKLVGLAQAGHDINLRNIFLDTPNPPKLGEIPKIQPPKIQTVTPHGGDWSIKASDRVKFEELFNTLKPTDGLIPGNTVRGLLMDSKLPLDTLSRIWDLSDQDKDGSLDEIEFIVAMHLVYQALAKKAIPSTLPIELQRANLEIKRPNNDLSDGGFVANFPSNIAPPPVPPLPSSIPKMTRIPPTVPALPNVAPLISTEVDLLTTSPPAVDWVVDVGDQKRFGQMFKNCDLDHDGLVSGMEVKDVFLQSGIPQLCLAKIWALCDCSQSGKLTSEQFALAMWMVDRKRNGIEPPDCLAPNMVPPSQRTADLMGGISGLDSSLLIQAEPPPPTYSNPELEMISKDIEELLRERRLLETEVAQKEADFRIKSGEVRSLQSELDTLAATLKQLESQKGEAQKRLDDLKNQVNKIREQCQKQEDTIKEQEGELDSRRSELQKLKDEETTLEKEYDANIKELQSLSTKLQDTQLQISQVKAMVSQLQESQRQMSDALTMCKSAIESNDVSYVSDYSLKLEPDFREAKSVFEVKEVDAFSPPGSAFGDNFKSNGFSSDPFGGSGFDGGFNTRSGFDDSFGNSFSNNRGDSDPFGDKQGGVQAVTPDPNKDDFGSDPFAILHAPTSAGQILSPNPSNHRAPPRPESPSPALPEKAKKAKQPPPRPAPPRPLQGPARTDLSSGFGSGGGGFADFADFDTKSAVVVSSTKDFVDDPFKDYRYEDVFSIKDPFADDNDDSSSDANQSNSYIDLSESTTATTDNLFSLNNNMKPIEEKTKQLKTASNLPEFDEFAAMNIVANGNNDKKVADKNCNIDNFNRLTEKVDNRVPNNTDTASSNNGFSTVFANSNKIILEKNVYKKSGDKVGDKFVADFSKSDNFDRDLEEALKRSLVEQ